MPHQQFQELISYLQLHLLQEYPQGHRLVTSRKRYLQFAHEARNRRYRVHTAVIPQSPPLLLSAKTDTEPKTETQREVTPSPQPKPQSQHEQKGAVNVSVKSSARTSSPTTFQQTPLSHEEIYRIIESCGRPLLKNLPCDMEARIHRRRWMLNSAGLILLCGTPETEEYTFYERMIKGITDQLTLSLLITSKEAAIWGDSMGLKFGKHTRLILLSPDMADQKKEFDFPTLLLSPYKEYESTAARRALWKQIQEYFS